MNKADLTALIARQDSFASPFHKAAAMIFNGLATTNMVWIGPLTDINTRELFEHIGEYYNEPELTTMSFAALELMIPDAAEQYVTAFFDEGCPEDSPHFETANKIAGSIMQMMQMETIKQMVAMAAPGVQLIDMHPLAEGEEMPPGYSLMSLQVTEDGLSLETRGGDPDDGTDNG